MHRAEKTGRFLSLMLVCLFTGYYVGVNFFVHVHWVDGKAVVHSHPYSDGSSSEPGHSHTSCDADCIRQLSFLNFLPILTVSCLTFAGIGREIAQPVYRRAAREEVSFCRFFRGPPALSVETF